MTDDDRRTLAQLLRTARTGALGTTHDGAPFVSHVVCAAAPDLTALYLHLSRLARHTQDLLADPRCAVMVSETERPTQNPLTLARLTLQGTAAALRPETDEYTAARTRYLEKLPFTQFNFTLGDFGLFRFEPASGRYVGGFARAFDLSPDDLRRAAAM